MSGFVDNLVTRHTGVGNKITPRLPGIFEPTRLQARDLSGNDFATTKVEPGNNSDPNAGAASEQLRNIPVTLGAEGIPDSINVGKKINFRGIAPDNFNDLNDEGKLTAENSNYLDHRAPTIPLDNTRERSTSMFLTGNDLSMSGRALDIYGDGQHNDDAQTSEKSHLEKAILPIKPVIRNEFSVRGDSNARSVHSRHVVLGESYLPSSLRPDSSLNGEALHSTSVIKISIGRIEVKAVSSPVVKQNNEAKIQKPKMSLEEYLAKRNNNNRS